MDGAKNAMYAQAGRSTSWSKIQSASADVVVKRPAMPEPPVVVLPVLVDEPSEPVFEPMPNMAKPQEKCQELAIAYVNAQKWQELYETDHGFTKGTIFSELDLPFEGKGACKHERA